MTIVVPKTLEKYFSYKKNIVYSYVPFISFGADGWYLIREHMTITARILNERMLQICVEDGIDPEWFLQDTGLFEKYTPTGPVYIENQNDRSCFLYRVYEGEYKRGTSFMV